MKSFQGFMKTHKTLCLFSMAVAIVSYGLYLINAEDILTDLETYIVHMADTIVVFEKVGRFGLYVTKKIFSTDSYIPSVSLCYMIVTMVLTAMFFDFSVWQLVDSSYRGSLEPFFFVFNGLFISCPVLIHQFYFYYQAFEVSFAFLLGILAANQIFAWIRGKEIYQLFIGLVCMIWSFATYQVMVPYYIAVNTVLFLFLYLYGKERDSYCRDCIKLVFGFLTGLIGYLLLAKLWQLLRHYPATTVLGDSYFCWGKKTIIQCLELIAEDIRRVCKHELWVFNRFYSLFTGIFCIWGAINGRRANKKGYGFFLLAMFIMISSTFFMSILLGNCQILRAHLVYPFVFAATAGMVAMFSANDSLVKYPVFALLAIMMFSQVDIANRYQQMIHFTADADKRMIQEIYTKAEAVWQEAESGERMYLPFVFIGDYAHPYPVSYIGVYEASGISYFEIDSMDVHRSRRIVRVMNAMGLPAAEPTEELYEYACQRSETMEEWPREGSCICENGMIIVKMGEVKPED